MKINLAYALLVLAALAASFPLSTAWATSPAEIEQGKRTMLDMFLFVWLLAGGFSALAMYATRNSAEVEELESSSVVVPPVKQESNILQNMIDS